MRCSCPLWAAKYSHIGRLQVAVDDLRWFRMAVGTHGASRVTGLQTANQRKVADTPLISTTRGAKRALLNHEVTRHIRIRLPLFRPLPALKAVHVRVRTHTPPFSSVDTAAPMQAAT